jgi:hypothetical protein
MKYTNKTGLPDIVYRAIANDPYEKSGDFSVTELGKPTQVWALQRRYDDEIEMDVSDLIYPLLGNNVHYILERGKEEGRNELVERQFLTLIKTKHGMISVSGRPDLYDENNILWDYKVTSMWTMIDGVKPEWEAQSNVYRYMLKVRGHEVKKMNITCIFRDWSKVQSMKNPNYLSKKQVHVLPVQNTWTQDEVLSYCRQNIEEKLSSNDLADSELPECSDEERWQQPTKYALMKGKNKRATKLFNDREEAMDAAVSHISKGKDFFVVERPGEYTRCKYYCQFGAQTGICKQYQKSL